MLQREICELRAQLASPNRQHRDSHAVSPETESAAPKHWRQAMIESTGDFMPLSLETAAEEDCFLELHTPVQTAEARSNGRWERRHLDLSPDGACVQNSTTGEESNDDLQLCGPVLAEELVSRQPQVAADAEMRVCRETRVDQGVGLLINQLQGLGLESMPDVDLLSLIDTLREVCPTASPAPSTDDDID